jgi:DNA-directed RNA polymerase specialized sigma24 family protein
MTARELERLVRAQRGTLVTVTRRAAGTREAAEDAVQEALTIAFVNRARIRPETALGYIAVTARHEAGRLRRPPARTESLDAPTRSGISRHELVADRRAVDHDAVLDALGALRELKREQARALAARMLGWRYLEIADAFGWTYTKTNRCVTEGRAAIRKALGADEPPTAPAAPGGPMGGPR